MLIVLPLKKNSTGSDVRYRDFFERPSVELRQDSHRVHSSASGRSPRHRLSAGNIEATTELNISELRGVENAFKPFYFRNRERGSDSRSEVLSRARNSTRPSHSHSLPSSPMNAPNVFDETPLDLYHSVPNMHFSFDSRPEPPINELETFHHSAHNMFYNQEPQDMDPIPVDLDLPDLSSAAAPAEAMETDEPMTISSTLIESLAKLTESAAADDNPFEPIPLSPPSKKRPSIVLSKDDFSNIDEPMLTNTFEEEE